MLSAGNKFRRVLPHYNDVMMGAIASQITNLTIVYSIVYSDADQRKHQSFASLAFVRGIQRWPVNSPHKWPFTRKMFPFGDIIMQASEIIMISNFLFGHLMTLFKMADEISTNLATPRVLTHLPLDKMATISQTTFSNAFSWKKMFEFPFNIHRN